MDRPGEIILAHAGSAPERALDAAGRGASWIILTEDYPRSLRWRDAIQSSGGAVVAAGPLVSAAADRLRRPFLDLITELGRTYDSVAWWASRISERNTMVSPLFLDCCYLRVVEELLAQRGTICVVSDRWPVLESLASIAGARSLRVRFIGRRMPTLRRTLSRIRTTALVGRFVFEGLLHRFTAPPRVDISQLRGPLVLMRTWPDDASFGAEGAFHDRYFPGLSQWLEIHGAVTFTIPVLLTLRPYRSAWRRLLASDRRFLAPEAYYRPSDYLFALAQARKGAAMPKRDELRLSGLDVGHLFDAERRRTAFDVWSLEALLSYRLPNRLAESGFEPELLVDTFENMVPEKPLLLGFRRYLPKARLVGFQHATLSPLTLCHFVTRGESSFAPFPDRVVCNGEFFRQILVREGLPPSNAVVGPALRYQHLRRILNEEVRPSGSGRLLATLPLVPSICVELLVKLKQAFADDERVQVDLKPHPMSAADELFRAARMETLPSNFRRIHGEMDAALRAAQVVVAIASGSLYEALAAGKPVVIVGRDAGLDLNPLAWYEDLRPVFSEPDAIRAQTLRLLSLSEGELAEHRARAARILNDSFNAVTDETMGEFVDGLIELPGMKPVASSPRQVSCGSAQRRPVRP